MNKNIVKQIMKILKEEIQFTTWHTETSGGWKYDTNYIEFGNTEKRLKELIL